MSYANIDEALTALADAIRNKFGYTDRMTIAKMVELVDALEIGSGSVSEDIKYGVVDANGKFQEIDISGEELTAVGGAVDFELSMFNVGRDEPVYVESGTAFAVVDESGNMQQLDLTGDEPEPVGEPETLPSIFIPNTGMDDPEY